MKSGPGRGLVARLTSRRLGVNCCENVVRADGTALHGTESHFAQHMRIICQRTAAAAAVTVMAMIVRGEEEL